jgi:hypothetical protein
MTSFRPVQKAILSIEQLAAFKTSKTYEKITSYIETLNSAVVGVKLTDECTQSHVRQLCLVPCHFVGVTHYLGNRSDISSTRSRRGPGEGDASGGQYGVEVREPRFQDVL